MSQQISVLTPILYIAVLLTAMAVFSSVYRRRKLTTMSKLQPWYPENFPRELYYSLKEATETQKVPDNIIRAAIIKWAAEDIRQLIKMRDSKAVLTTLHQRGSVGDELWKRYTTSERLLELEIGEITQEANKIHPNWAQELLATAGEVAQNEALRKRIAEFPSQQAEYRETYEALHKSSIKELSK